MTDRELLERAAKAAKLDPLLWSKCRGWLCETKDGSPRYYWNPLADDGDALRLAVKLGLDVFCRPAQWSECGRIGLAGFREKYAGDPYAATRRAIVRAAAAIAKDKT